MARGANIVAGAKGFQKVHGEANRRTLCRTKLYQVWSQMKGRCTRPKHDGWKWYGGKGIRVCEQWQTYEPFRVWALANGYADGMSLDRVDPDRDYEPSNCRWLTKSENSRLASVGRWERRKLLPIPIEMLWGHA